MEAEKLSEAEIKEHEKRFGELKAIRDSKVECPIFYEESSINGKVTRPQFLQKAMNINK